MFTFLVSLFTMFAAPTGLATAPAPIAPVAASRQLDWLGGIWRGGGLEMKCGPTKQGVMCSEEGTSAAMQGAKAELTFDTLGDRAVLELALPSIPPSRFTEVARDAQSVTFEMPTKAGDRAAALHPHRRCPEGRTREREGVGERDGISARVSFYSSPSLLGEGDRPRSGWWRGGYEGSRDLSAKFRPLRGRPSVIASRCHLPCGAGEERRRPQGCPCGLCLFPTPAKAGA
ncbi:hypothetical protein [Sphingomonas sp. J315]|uniref:hypothetical protein n=1 Tax=Sphingomonas sp. J315 TaxID=2898433 RepID=UPI0021ADE678|nr:hypothetical protein [Sphingomonas sp. J315]UUX98552.1 hypothetical protein LRS08_13450 [Sphingomonas sp. J315]